MKILFKNLSSVAFIFKERQILTGLTSKYTILEIAMRKED